MKITRNNYESWFIDLIDGNLSAREVDEVLDFLRENPDLKEELNHLEKIVLKPEEITGINKAALKKEEFDRHEVFEEYAVRSIENDLTRQEQGAFRKYLNKNENAANEFRLFEATVSEPDILLTYHNKNALKRTRSIGLGWVLSTAAAVVLAVVFWFTLPADELLIPQKQKVAVLEAPMPIPKLHQAELNRELAQFAEPVQYEKQAETENQIEMERIDEQLEMMASLDITISRSLIRADHLAPINKLVIPENEKIEPYPSVPELLAQGVEQFDARKPMNRFAQLALDRLSEATDEKLSYSTGEKGGLKKIEYSSRLLAFTVPVGN